MRSRSKIQITGLLLLGMIFIECQNNNSSNEEKSVASTPEIVTPPEFDAKWQIFDTHDYEAGLRGLSTVSDQVVWASGSGGTILKTIDGGATWQKVIIPEAKDLGFRDIEAFNADTALVISIESPARIFKTVDGGKTWKQTYSYEHKDVFFDSFAFWNAKDGIAFSDPIDGKLFIITTEDSGESWQQVDPSNIPPVIKGEAGFAASGTVVTVYGDRHAWIGTGGKVSRVFYTTDKGKTWDVADTPVLDGESSKGIFSLVFKDENHGLAVGGDYEDDQLVKNNAAFTTDGGKTWTLTNQMPHGFRSCVSYFGEAKEKVIALGTSGTDYSPDGGQTWYLLDTLAFNVVSFSKDGLSGFAAGPKGVIAKLETKDN